MSDYGAVLFDLDGTLLDTIDDLTDAMNSALSACGYPTRSTAQCKHFVGDGVPMFVRRAMPPRARDDAAAVARVTELYRAAYAKNWADKTRPYDGVPELLDALAGRGLPVAVYSNKPDDSTKLVVGKLLGRWSFAAVVGHRDGYAHKPDPATAIEIAGVLGVRPVEVLYVGDTGTDMRTAVAAGMYPVGALWGFRSAEELKADGAKVLVKEPMELIELLGAGQ